MKYGLEEQTLQTIFLIFGKYPEVEEVILYGSRAKGNFKPFSDIDITLKGKISPETLLSINCAFSESSLPYLFDISIFNDLNNQNLIDHINRWGKVIYTATSTDISAIIKANPITKPKAHPPSSILIDSQRDNCFSMG